MYRDKIQVRKRKILSEIIFMRLGLTFFAESMLYNLLDDTKRRKNNPERTVSVKMNVLTAKYEISEDTLKVTLSGEIDHHSAKEAREEIDRRIYEAGVTNVCLDLKKVGFMDSSGLGLILGRYTRVKEIGGTMKILNPGRSAERVLRLAGTDKIIPIEYTEK